MLRAPVSRFVLRLLLIGVCVAAHAKSNDEVACEASWVGVHGAFDASSFYEYFAKQVGLAKSKRGPNPLHACIKGIDEISTIRNLLIVDFRPLEEFDLGHLPGAISLPKYQLKTKNTFKSSPLLIVDDAKRYLDNLALCEELPLIGFSEIYLLRGGYQASVNLGKQSKGAISTISAIEFIRVSEKKAWLVLDFSARLNSYPDRVLKMSEGKAVGEILSETEKRYDYFVETEGFKPQVLVVDENGTSNSAISTRISPKILGNSFFLEGGLAAFDKEIEKQGLIQDKKRLTTSTKEQQCR